MHALTRFSIAVLCTFAGLAVAQPSAGVDAPKPQAAAPAAKLQVRPLSDAVTVFRDVTVITMTDAGTLPARAVTVRSGRIESISEDAKATIPKDALVVNAKGKFLIPGLCDMHVHFPPLPGDKGDPSWRAATLLLANGVTTARGMVGADAHIELRRRMATGELLGAMCYFASPPMSVQMVKSPEQARELVKAFKNKGFDLVKSHRVLVPEVYEAIQEAAKAEGIPVAGHVDNEVTLDRALKAGMQIEHLDGTLAELVPEEAREGWAQMPTPEVRDQADAAKIPEVVARVKKSDVWVTPTLALFEVIADTKTPNQQMLSKPELKYILPNAVKMWAGQRQHSMEEGPFTGSGLGPWFTKTRAAFVAEMKKQGVPLMAGSDSPQFFLVTGFALHEELASLVKAGLTPTDALKAATANPATYLRSLSNGGSAVGIEADFGTITAGQRADLVLLSADPTANIANTRKIEGVCVRGKWLDRAALDALLAEVEASVQPKPPATP
jgi:imidazolonepropionase-like amidohydrolase